MKRIVLLCLILFASTIIYSQTLDQTIKGRVIDKASQTSLPGATVVVEDTHPLMGTMTDSEGYFRIENVPVGRHNLQISYMGYTPAVVSELMVGSGKEINLEIGLLETVSELNEVTVKAFARKDKPINSMAGISARAFTVEETRRYAGGMDDPARMASAFAGVTTAGLQDNAIIIRGNSPKGILWRVEGVDVPNPNHFSGGNVAGGGFVNIISAQVLSNSDFYTGAFPAEFGNALAGVFDIRLRTGNSEKREYTAQLGMHGIDVAAEGPFVKGKRSSFIFNYRYSTFGLLSTLGALPTDQIPRYQDLSFKMNFPTKKAGTFSLWGMGGIDQMTDKEERDSSLWEYDDDLLSNSWEEKFGALGLNHKYIFGLKSYLHTSIVASGNFKDLKQQKLDESLVLRNDLDLYDVTGKITLSVFLNHKFSAWHTNRTGLNLNTLFYDMNLNGTIDERPDTYRNFVTEDGKDYHLQFYSQSRYNFSDKFWVNLGFQSEYFALNKSLSIDPRIGFNWEFANSHALSFGFGKHSQLEDLKIYFINNPQNGQNFYPNRELGFSHAHHLVLGYDWRITENTRLKIEPYLQHLYDVPGIADSSYSMINFKQDFTFREALENNSIGKNRGIDLTLERFLKNNFYYLVTASIFDSKYKADDDVWRNTRYNRSFVGNVLVGKEFITGKNKNNILGLNARLNVLGGERTTPLLEAESNEARRPIFDETRAFEQKEDLSSILNLTFTYRINKKNHSSVWALQVNNALGTPQNREYSYNHETRQVKMIKDTFVMPGISYKIEF